MKKRNFFNRLIASLRTPTFYVEILKESSGRALGYLMILLLIIGLITGVIRGITLSNDMDEFIIAVKSNDFPEFKFEDGIFSIDSEVPIDIKFEKQYRFLIDTTKEKTINDLAGYDSAYLLTQDRLFISQKGNSPTSYELKTFAGFTLDKPELINNLEVASSLMFPITLILNLIFLIVSVLFKSIIVLFIGFILKNTYHIGKLKGSALYKMVFYAMTFGIIVGEIFSFIPILSWFNISPSAYLTLLPFFTFYLPTSIFLGRGLKAYKTSLNNVTDESLDNKNL